MLGAGPESRPCPGAARRPRSCPRRRPSSCRGRWGSATRGGAIGGARHRQRQARVGVGSDPRIDDGASTVRRDDRARIAIRGAARIALRARRGRRRGRRRFCAMVGGAVRLASPPASRSGSNRRKVVSPMAGHCRPNCGLPLVAGARRARILADRLSRVACDGDPGKKM